MDNKTLETITSTLMNKLYSLAYAVVPSDLEAEQLIVDSYTRFVVKDKELILDEEINGSFDRGSFTDFCLERIIQEMYDLGKKRAQSYFYTRKNSFDEFNSFYSLSLESRFVIHLNTVLAFNESRISKTLNLNRHEVVQLMFTAKTELLQIGGGLSDPR